MKRICSLICAFVLLFGIAKAQCILGTTVQRASALPCISQDVPYNDHYQIYVPDSIQFGGSTIYIDSAKLDTIHSLLHGIHYTITPPSGVVYGGQYLCVQVSGTTTDTPGTYPLYYFREVYPHGGAMLSFTTNIVPDDSLVVCEGVSGISNNARNLSAAINIYPNPGNGIFSLTLNAATRMSGEIAIIDIAGKKVFSESIDIFGLYTKDIDLTKFAKGLYTVQLRTAEGFASKNISIQ